MLNYLPFVVALAEDTEAETASGGTLGESLISFLPIVAVLIVFYFVLIRPQQKQQKKAEKMRDSLEIGDEIITAGGVIGRVISIKEDNIIIETGGDRSKLRIAKWAIQQNNTVHEEQSK
ncbi:MAG TPA: preprotein translocase subunit YajC [Oscillospiraceae bacterium]|nr:preprotein translocase subunit YajC [Oscillospiraceae bacterium]